MDDEKTRMKLTEIENKQTQTQNQSETGRRSEGKNNAGKNGCIAII